MRLIDQFLKAPLPEMLFHYTNVGALLRIVESRRFHASHAYYLNDARELHHGCDLLGEMAAVRAATSSGTEATFFRQLEQWMKTFREPHNIFIVSLSTQGSLLSQWRSYTAHGKGVNMGLDAKRLAHLRDQHRLIVAPCIYDKPAQAALVNTLMNLCAETFKQRGLIPGHTSEHPDALFFHFLEEFRGDFLQVLARLKHESFAEESEWRIISDYISSHHDPRIRFREGAAMLVPYIELSLDNETDDTTLFDVVQIGPSRHQNLAMNSLGSFLINTRACRHTVNASLPYREW